jgi:ribonuclease HI
MPADLYIRQHLVEFYLRHLTYGHDLLQLTPPVRGVNSTTAPVDVLRLELEALSTHLPLHTLRNVEQRLWWYTDPTFDDSFLSPSFLDREKALDCIRHARATSTPDHLWVFTDGSLSPDTTTHMDQCGSSAVFFKGTDTIGHSVALRFTGYHSSTHTELIALLLACLHAPNFGPFHRCTIACDPMSALQAIQCRQGGKQLAVITRRALLNLHACIPSLRLWWIPGHIGIFEHDQADYIAKQAANGLGQIEVISVPHSYTALKTSIRLHYVSRLETLWRTSTHGRQLYEVMPRFSRSLSWTKDLSRRDVSLVAQFLTGHYPTNQYLHRFHLIDDPQCTWCHSPIDDRTHRLFHCPRFAFLRQHLTSEIRYLTRGQGDWNWAYLSGSGRSFLARFLRVVRRASTH